MTNKQIKGEGDEQCTTTSASSLLDEIYFGNVECRLSPSNGQTFRVIPGETVQLNSLLLEEDGGSNGCQGEDVERAKTQVNRYLEPCSFLGPEYGTLIMPCVPALPMTVQSVSLHDRISLDMCESSTLRCDKPLVKDAKGTIIGVQSGVRSALVKCHSNNNNKDDNKEKINWIRLKGCGNNYDGFPIRSVDHKTEYRHCVNIRGCSFESTCFRELYYAEKVNELLRSSGQSGGNQPIGWFEYDVNHSNDTESTLFPAIKRLCSVFKTRGEKRLSDHLLVGLETMIKHVSYSQKSLMSMIPNNRRNQYDENTLESTWWVITQHEAMGETFTDFVDTYSLDLRLDTSPFISQNSTEIPSRYRDNWLKCASIVGDASVRFSESYNLFSYVYWRVGREVGQFQKLLLDHNISWGTYSDQLGDHCNAHPNNFVVLPPSSTDPSHFLLAPVDFDMAYGREEFTREDHLWQQWIDQEKQALVMELGGAMLSTGLRELVQYDDAHSDNLRWSLRDTMVLAYLEALNGKQDRHPVIPELHEKVHALIQMALILTSTLIA